MFIELAFNYLHSEVGDFFFLVYVYKIKHLLQWQLFMVNVVLHFRISSKILTDGLDLPMSLCLDVALVTSLRDGMNLVSYEFVACQDAKKGVLILSEVIAENLSLLMLDLFSPSKLCMLLHSPM